MLDAYLGEIRSFAFGYAPRGWEACDGQLLPIQQFQALFSLLGTTYGGNGTTTFALPDLRGRVPIDASPAHPQGQSDGEEAQVLTPGQMPAHTHQWMADGDVADSASPSDALAAASTPTDPQWSNSTATVAMAAELVGTAGTGAGHANMQPYLVVEYCIAVDGNFPPRN